MLGKVKVDPHAKNQGQTVQTGEHPQTNGRTHMDSTKLVISARCNIYISRLCYDVSVRLSVTEVHWHIIVNLSFKFRS